jgi:predicted naringenin-chalcone synthase
VTAQLTSLAGVAQILTESESHFIVQTRTQPALLSLGTATPAFQAHQTELAQWMIGSFTGQPALGRWLRGLYASSGIETRHTCIDDFLQPVAQARFAPGQPLAQIPTTAERMAIYEREAPALAADAARVALARLAQATGISAAAVAQSITHLVVVSCTGFFAPGLDLALVQRLGLGPQVERSMIGFMGCSAAFNGLRAAHHIVRSRPEARVLVVCVELCSLHIQPGTERENLISASLFADGAAACVVGNAQTAQGDCLSIDDFHSEVKPDTQQSMVWQIGNHGFALRLSPRVPKDLAEIAPAALRRLGPPADFRFWAIHPGGPAIVDQLADVFALSSSLVEPSRAVLRRYGNVSSATILFVLDELRSQLQQSGRPQTGVAMAFGPGLVIEMARLTYLPARPTLAHNQDREQAVWRQPVVERVVEPNLTNSSIS